MTTADRIQMEVKSQIKGLNLFTLTDRQTETQEIEKMLLSPPLTVDASGLHI